MTDEELMKAYAEGDMQAFDSIYQRHKSRVLGYLLSRTERRSEAEEVFQEVFTKLHQNRHKYRDNIPFLPWLFTIVKHTLIDQVRKQKARSKHIELSTDSVTDPAICEPSQSDVGEIISELRTLSSNQQKVLMMRFNDDLTFAEISAQLDISSPNARKLLSRAIAKLRLLMQRKETKYD